MKRALLDQAERVAKAELSKHPEFNNYAHTSFIVQGNQIVEWGTNRQGVPPIHLGYRPQSKLHSELVAYRKAKGLLNGQEFGIINVRLNRQGDLKISAPCPHCYAWLKAVGCKEMFYTTSSGWGKMV